MYYLMWGIAGSCTVEALSIKHIGLDPSSKDLLVDPFPPLTGGGWGVDNPSKVCIWVGVRALQRLR